MLVEKEWSCYTPVQLSHFKTDRALAPAHSLKHLNFLQGVIS